MMPNSQSIAILDIGLGNTASIHRMLVKVGENAVLIQKPSQLRAVTKVILPGVGHFDEGAKLLHVSGFSDALIRLANQKRICILGICLGMQLLCRSSEEGSIPGLGLIDADVQKFRFSIDQKIKVPHMGWNIVQSVNSSALLPQILEEQRFYFVHSYKVVPDDAAITVGVTHYGGEFCAAFQKDIIFGVQFHPEKSHRFGMALMQRFVDL